MLKKINKLFWMTIIFSLLLLVIGILIILLPNISLKVISIVLALTLLIFGLILIFDYKTRILYTQFISLGVLFIILGFSSMILWTRL